MDNNFWTMRRGEFLLREPELEEMITAALTGGEAQSRDVAMNGGRPARHFAVHAVPMRDPAGGPGVVAIFRDITRLKQLEDVRREFVANVSHELRTPLSIFRGYLENLRDDPAMPRKEQAEVFEILSKHSLRLNALLTPNTAFGFMALVSAFGALLAVRQDAFWLAFVAIVEGFAAPVLVGGGSDAYAPLMSYMAVLDLGILAMAWFKAWRPLNLVGAVATSAPFTKMLATPLRRRAAK